MDTTTATYVRSHRDRQLGYFHELKAAGADAGVTSLAYTATVALDTLVRAHAIGLDEATVLRHNLGTFRAVAAGAPAALESTYAGLVADIFVSVEHRMGNIGEPLHEDEGADEEPLYVPEVVPATPEHEPVPA